MIPVADSGYEIIKISEAEALMSEIKFISQFENGEREVERDSKQSQSEPQAESPKQDDPQEKAAKIQRRRDALLRLSLLIDNCR